MRDHDKPCKCGDNRWKTVKKGASWKCRGCGEIRVGDQPDGDRLLAASFKELVKFKPEPDHPTDADIVSSGSGVPV